MAFNPPALSLAARNKLGSIVYRYFRGQTLSRAYVHAQPEETDKQLDIQITTQRIAIFYQTVILTSSQTDEWIRYAETQRWIPSVYLTLRKSWAKALLNDPVLYVASYHTLISPVDLRIYFDSLATDDWTPSQQSIELRVGITPNQMKAQQAIVYTPPYRTWWFQFNYPLTAPPYWQVYNWGVPITGIGYSPHREIT